MTDILIRDPNDTGEIILAPKVGDTGEHTQRIDPRLLTAPSFESIPRRQIDQTAKIYIAQTIGVVPDFDGPQLPPPPLPPIPDDQGLVQPLWPLERVAGADDTVVHKLMDTFAGELEPELRPEQRGTLVRSNSARTRWVHRGRHRKPAPLWTMAALFGGLGVIAGAIASGLTMLAVTW